MTTATQIAFEKFRAEFGPARDPKKQLIKNDDEKKLMTEVEGLCQWVDGCQLSAENMQEGTPPIINKEDLEHTHLWVVRHEDVVHAAETCPHGKKLESKVIKHTNLTGGLPAYCGGEIIFHDNETLVINGRSGRYGPRSAEELKSVVKSFKQSGYIVWAMGYDSDLDFPLPFLGTAPSRVD